MLKGKKKKKTITGKETQEKKNILPKKKKKEKKSSCRIEGGNQSSLKNVFLGAKKDLWRGPNFRTGRVDQIPLRKERGRGLRTKGVFPKGVASQ